MQGIKVTRVVILSTKALITPGSFLSAVPRVATEPKENSSIFHVATTALQVSANELANNLKT